MQTERSNECAKVCRKNKGFFLLKTTCEGNLGTVLLVVTRVTNTEVVLFSTICMDGQKTGFYTDQMITVTLNPGNTPCSEMTQMLKCVA